MPATRERLAWKEARAKLLREHYCDGLGNCLPVCPTGAITFEEREAAAYDESAMKKTHNNQKKNHRILAVPVAALIRFAGEPLSSRETPFLFKASFVNGRFKSSLCR
jgi:ferredoxin